MPKISQQAMNLALSVGNAMAYAKATGKIKAEKEVIAKRQSICGDCPHKVDNRCSACGCFLTLKTGIQSESCPLKKW